MTAKLTRHETWIYAGLAGSLLVGSSLLLRGEGAAPREGVAGVPAGAPAREVARGDSPGRGGQRREGQGRDAGRQGQGDQQGGEALRGAVVAPPPPPAPPPAPAAPPAPPAPAAPPAGDPAPPVGTPAREDHDRRAWQASLAAADTHLIDQLERMGCDPDRIGRVRQALQERAAARERTREEFEARRIDLKEAGKRGARAQARFDRALGETLTPGERARLDPEGARAAVAVEAARR